MGILSHLLLSLTHLACVAIDVLALFLMVRLFCIGKSRCWLSNWDTAGKQLVEGYARFVGGVWYRLSGRQLTYKATLVIGLLALAIARTFLPAIW